jgi:hypothetical protein
MGRTKSRGGVVRRRRRRAARKPRWLLSAKDLDLMAQRRCLMILSVLSGEASVEEAARQAQITPPLYYLLERKGLSGMLAALLPGATSEGSAAPMLKQLQARVDELEKTKRRLERLLFLTRMTLKPGPMTQGRAARSSTKSGSSASTKLKTTNAPNAKKPNSTSTLDGASAQSHGTES